MISRRATLRSVVTLVAGLFACTAHLQRIEAPVPETPVVEKSGAHSPAKSAPAIAQSVAPAPTPHTVINFDEDTSGPLPGGPELEVVDARKKAHFDSLLDSRYRRDAGAAAQATEGAGADTE